MASHHPRPCEGLHEGRREHDKPEAESGARDFGEGAEVYDPAAVIKSLEGLKRVCIVSELPVVIVFENPDALPPRPFQEGQVSRCGHRHPGGVLVGRRHVRQDGIGSVSRTDDRALGIQLEWQKLSPGCMSDGAHAGVGGFFQGDGIPGIGQERGQYIEGLPGPRRHGNLLRGTPDTSGRPHVAGHGASERHPAHRITVLREHVTVARRAAPDALRHSSLGKTSAVTAPGRKARGAPSGGSG